MIFTEILTPEYVPERLTDRETLWNEVEHVEWNNKAQLAYSFDIALQLSLIHILTSVDSKKAGLNSD